MIKSPKNTLKHIIRFSEILDEMDKMQTAQTELSVAISEINIRIKELERRIDHEREIAEFREQTINARSELRVSQALQQVDKAYNDRLIHLRREISYLGEEEVEIVAEKKDNNEN